MASFFLLDVKNMYLACMANLFKISNLFYGGDDILMSLYSIWEVRERDSLRRVEQAGMFAVYQCQD